LGPEWFEGEKAPYPVFPVESVPGDTAGEKRGRKGGQK
jgi:hypothetical protein